MKEEPSVWQWALVLFVGVPLDMALYLWGATLIMGWCAAPFVAAWPDVPLLDIALALSGLRWLVPLPSTQEERARMKNEPAAAMASFVGARATGLGLIGALAWLVHS